MRLTAVIACASHCLHQPGDRTVQIRIWITCQNNYYVSPLSSTTCVMRLNTYAVTFKSNVMRVIITATNTQFCLFIVTQTWLTVICTILALVSLGLNEKMQTLSGWSVQAVATAQIAQTDYIPMTCNSSNGLSHSTHQDGVCDFGQVCKSDKGTFLGDSGIIFRKSGARAGGR